LAEKSICVLPALKGPGGPSSFQSKLRKGLADLGINVHHNIRQPGTEALLIIAGTKRIGDLLYARRKGIRVVQRLDGMNWLHRRQPTGFRHFLRSERMNYQMALIRRFFADAVVYQSGFTRDWWNTVYGSMKKPCVVIHNGVDLNTFHPQGDGDLPTDFIRLLVVEGSFKGGHERDHLLFPAEINAACPNAVVEALASGLPVVGYATGSLPELVGEDGGAVVPYGTDYWKLEAPDTDILAAAAVKILKKHKKYSTSARKRAEELFGLEKMVESYRKILLEN